MVRNRFEEALDKLNNDLAVMGDLVTVAIEKSLTSLKNCDTDLAKQVIKGDHEVNEMEKSIERHCITLLLRQQPVASDLRLISTALKMITDLERIGDQAADIAEITLSYCETSRKENSFETTSKMAEETIRMVKTALKAFRDGDLALADEVIATDDRVDAYFDSIRDQVIQGMQDDIDEPESLVDVLMIAKYLERIGDHAENVAEWVVFSITGKHESIDDLHLHV